MSNRPITDGEPAETTGADEAAEDQRGAGKGAVDVSVAQVAGSALAAVIAALIAGKLGVYGTIIGAGVISVVATTGGPVFQHLLRRTGEGVKEQVKQQSRGATPARPQRAAGPAPAERTVAMPTLGQDTLERTQVLRVKFPPPHGDPPAAVPDDYSAPRTHGTRLRGRRRTLLPAVLVFVVAMGGITLYEALSGHNVSGGSGGTSIGQVLTRDSGTSTGPEDNAPNRPTDDATDQEQDGADPQHDPADETGDPLDEQPDTDPGAPDPGTGNPGTSGGSSDSGDSGSTPKPTPTPTPTPTPGDGTGDAPAPGEQDATGGGHDAPQQHRQPRTDSAPDGE